VLAWAAQRLSAGRNIYQLRDESRAGTHNWPEPGVYLGQNAAEKVVAIVRDRQRRNDPSPPPKPKRPKATEGGKRVRKLHDDKRAGLRDAEDEVWKMQVGLAESIGYLERFDLPELDFSEGAQDLLNDIVHDLERHRAWNERAWDAVWALMGDVTRQRRMHELGKRADDPSSTPWERRTARELVEKMEQKYWRQKHLGQASSPIAD
jgi:hypothetical protein